MPSRKEDATPLTFGDTVLGDNATAIFGDVYGDIHVQNTYRVDSAFGHKTPSQNLIERYNDVHITYTIERVLQLRNGQDTEAEFRWEHDRQLAEGSSSIVYLERCVQGPYERRRAVKKIRQSWLTQNHIDFKKEIGALAKLADPKYAYRFVQFHSWFGDTESLYLFMEFAQYGDLSQHIGEGLEEAESREISLQILDGLAIMHSADIVHRDIKPANILVMARQPSWWVKIGDFGAAKSTRTQMTFLYTNVGTEFYSAPEVTCPQQREKEMYYDARCDIWSFGIMLYEMLAGRLPFNDYRQLVQYEDGAIDLPSCPGASRPAILFVRKLLQPVARHRFSAKEALLSLEMQWPEPRDTRRVTVQNLGTLTNVVVRERDKSADSSTNKDNWLINEGDVICSKDMINAGHLVSEEQHPNFEASVEHIDRQNPPLAWGTYCLLASDDELISQGEWAGSLFCGMHVKLRLYTPVNVEQVSEQLRQSEDWQHDLSTKERAPLQYQWHSSKHSVGTQRWRTNSDPGIEIRTLEDQLRREREVADEDADSNDANCDFAVIEDDDISDTSWDDCDVQQEDRSSAKITSEIFMEQPMTTLEEARSWWDESSFEEWRKSSQAKDTEQFEFMPWSSGEKDEFNISDDWIVLPPADLQKTVIALEALISPNPKTHILGMPGTTRHGALSHIARFSMLWRDVGYFESMKVLMSCRAWHLMNECNSDILFALMFSSSEIVRKISAVLQYKIEISLRPADLLEKPLLIAFFVCLMGFEGGCVLKDGLRTAIRACHGRKGALDYDMEGD